MKPRYRLTYRESTMMGRKIAYFIPISGAKFTETYRQGPCGYCNEMYGSLDIYGLLVQFREYGTDGIKKQTKEWWRFW